MTSTSLEPSRVDAILLGDSPCDTLTELPKELGILLFAVGVVGVVAPGVPGTPAMVAACVILWPEGFGWLEHYFARRFPRTHRMSLDQMTRYLRDMERRYPAHTRAA
jgi:hypothetical protein